MIDFIKGMDLSTLIEVERCGGQFFDHGIKGDALDILEKYGMNMVRIRLFNDPYTEDGKPYGAGVCDLDTVLTLAKRVREKKIPWMLDLHYSDCWADPGKQTLPKKWKGMNEDQIEKAVYEYTKEVLMRCKQENVIPKIVAVGNELSNGLLWETGKFPNFENITRYVSAGIKAVREIDEKIETMVHLDNGGNNELYRCWFDNYWENGGADFEYIGLSYYPFWHGTLDMLRNNMNDIAMRYGKRLIITEVSTAFTLEDYADYEKLSPEERKGMATKPEVVEKVPFDMSPEGQAEFMEKIGQIVKQVPNHLGKGFCYWEAAWIPVPGSQWATKEGLEYMNEKGPGGNEWANQALFDYDGNALPALDVIQKI